MNRIVGRLVGPSSLIGIGTDAMLASDKFLLDANRDEVLAEVIHDWAAPEVNFPLTQNNVKKFRAWLARAEPYPAKPSNSRPPYSRRDKITSIKEEKSVRYS